MSSWLETRSAARKPLLILAASVAIGVVAASALYAVSGTAPLQSNAPAVAPPCIALAIDRDTGLTREEPCTGQRLLMAVTPKP